MNRKLITSALIAGALCLGVFAAPALAQVNVSIDLGLAPPPPRYEPYEEPRPGFVLLPGYWFWDGHQHRWADRRWTEARPGKHWQAERWETRGKKHHFQPGRWEADRSNGRGQGQNHGNDKGRRNGNGNDNGRGRGN